MSLRFCVYRRIGDGVQYPDKQLLFDYLAITLKDGRGITTHGVCFEGVMVMRKHSLRLSRNSNHIQPWKAHKITKTQLHAQEFQLACLGAAVFVEYAKTERRCFSVVLIQFHSRFCQFCRFCRFYRDRWDTSEIRTLWLSVYLFVFRNIARFPQYTTRTESPMFFPVKWLGPGRSFGSRNNGSASWFTFSPETIYEY